MHVVRLSRVAELDPARGGGHQAHQICVRSINLEGSREGSARSDTPLPLIDTTTESQPSTQPTYVIFRLMERRKSHSLPLQVYSNGLSEIILGNAIKKLELPREEIVIMTKVGGSTRCSNQRTNSSLPSSTVLS